MDNNKVDFNNTMNYPIAEHTNNIREILRNVYVALREKGYNPNSQLVGYLMSGDPTYITSYLNARTRERKVLCVVSTSKKSFALHYILSVSGTDTTSPL